MNKEPLPQATVDVVQGLVDHTCFCKLSRENRRGLQPLRLMVHQVVRVQNGFAWQEYNKERARVREEVAGKLEV